MKEYVHIGYKRLKLNSKAEKNLKNSLLNLDNIFK